jgi:RNA polymerase sigma-70 factor (ECF subfamily)
MVSRVLAGYRAFSSFLEQQVGSRAVSEDILREAFVRNTHTHAALSSGESAVEWFYRLLRNAAFEQPRYAGTTEHKLAAFRAELTQRLEPSPALRSAILSCVGELAGALDAEDANALRCVELDGVGVDAFAQQSGISVGAAVARITRARTAFQQQFVKSCGACPIHGGRNCTCGSGLAGYGHGQHASRGDV